MNIKEFSRISGISAHTLRYYEKIGILQGVERNASGHREFTQRDIVWAEFITRLKETGMPLEQIRKYAELRNAGEQTSLARMRLLQDHASALEEKIAGEKRHLEKIRTKIAFYEELIAEKNQLDLE